MATRDRQHIIVEGQSDPIAYTSHDSARKKKPPAPASRARHGAALKRALLGAQQVVAQRRADAVTAGLTQRSAVTGVYVQFESEPNVELNVESLEDRRGPLPIEVVAFSEDEATIDGEVVRIQRATVFVPDGAVRKLIEKFDVYKATPAPGVDPPRTRRHHDSFDRVKALKLATLRAFWTDEPDLYPSSDDVPVWWEVWLRRLPDNSEVDRLRAFAGEAGLVVGARTLGFDDRAVVLVNGTAEMLASSIDVLDVIAELRSAKSVNVGIERLTNAEQRNIADDLLRRVARRQGDRPSVCLLDTGVNRGHPLLESDLDEDDLHTVDPAWLTSDHAGHGTEMAGLALHGNLAPLVGAGSTIDVAHRLESVKILPPRVHGVNPPELYGAITAHGVALPEIQAPDRRRVFSMAVTAEESDRGRPTSWSAAVDALAVGRSFDTTRSGLSYLDDTPSPRLLLVSAGNVSVLEQDHLARSDLEGIEDPAQAWNAVTVGAHTELAYLAHPGWPGGAALAPGGELSPWSRTSMTFEKKWPLKPDIVMEGGNVVRAANGTIQHYGAGGTSPAESLNVLTTSAELQSRLFELSWATSAATAQAARLAARICAEYPALWPETIRALLVHSARWTPRMLQSIPPLLRSDVRHLVRRYGFGVPDEARALRSGRDALTLVHEGTIRPFDAGALRELHLHALPWPAQELERLGEASVLLRVTLSYFVEPNPSRRGQTSRYRYPSHGLRFELKRATETVTTFRKRINKKELADGEGKPKGSSDIAEWKLGELRDLGSLHQDFWEGSAADLAERGVIAIYPVSGWWKDMPKRDRSAFGARYALVVSIETDAQGADLWTPVAQEVGLATEVET